MKSLLLIVSLLTNCCNGVDYWSEPPPPVWEQVYEDVRDLADERHRPGQDWKLQAAPGFSSDPLENIVALYAEAISFWSGAFDFPQTVPLTVMDENDRDWWESTTTRGPRDLFDPNWWDRRVHPGRAVGMVTADHLGMPHIIAVVGSEVDFEYFGAFSAPLITRHETTHWFQYIASGWMTDKCSNPHWEAAMGWQSSMKLQRLENWTMSCPWTSMPCWFAEGHAELYTIPFGDHPDRLRGLRIWQITHRAEDGLLELLTQTRHNLTTGDYECTHEVMYSIGLLVNEKLFYDFGDEKVNEFWLAIDQPSSATDPSWGIAFSDTFGVAAEDWYTTSAIPYLLEVFEN